jgi:hypothetical protein
VLQIGIFGPGRPEQAFLKATVSRKGWGILRRNEANMIAAGTDWKVHHKGRPLDGRSVFPGDSEEFRPPNQNTYYPLKEVVESILEDREAFALMAAFKDRHGELHKMEWIYPQQTPDGQAQSDHRQPQQERVQAEQPQQQGRVPPNRTGEDRDDHVPKAAQAADNSITPEPNEEEAQMDTTPCLPVHTWSDEEDEVGKPTRDHWDEDEEDGNAI